VLRADNKEIASADLAGASARLRCTMKTGGECTFAFAESGDAALKPIGRSFQAVEGVWIGAKVGLFAATTSTRSADHADFDYFRFE
jgi:hypothetical protein